MTARHAAARSGSIYTRSTFWSGVGERAVKTFAQALLAFIPASATLAGVDWEQALAAAALAALLSVLTSLADPERADTAVATGGGGVDGQ